MISFIDMEEINKLFVEQSINKIFYIYNCLKYINTI